MNPDTFQSPKASANRAKNAPKEHILTAVMMAGPRGFQRAYGSLSGPGFNIVATGMSVYCALLSVESLFVAVPNVLGDRTQPAEDVRFVPKFYVNDGAQLGRISPLPNMQRFAFNHLPMVPDWVVGSAASDKWTVWNSPGLLLMSLMAALVIQRFEAMVLRRKPASVVRAKFEKANRLKRVRADKDSLAEAKVRARQYNSYGTGNLLIKTIGVTGVYALELCAFLGSFAGSVAFPVTLTYGFLTIFGYEIFELLGKEAQDESI